MIQDNLLFLQLFGAINDKKVFTSQFILDCLLLFKVPQITFTLIIYRNLLIFLIKQFNWEITYLKL